MLSSSANPDPASKLAAHDFESFERDLPRWLEVIRADNEEVRRVLGSVKLAAWISATRLLSSPRALKKMLSIHRAPKPSRMLQQPWLPLWPHLAATPLHEQRSHSWTDVLRQASTDIRNEALQVCEKFSRSEYQSDARKEKEWGTYVFYSRCRPNRQHLDACPRTKEVLAQIPHSGVHVCFSAIDPGATLTPHTGATNAVLTAHLGLANCEESRLWVGGQTAQYQQDQVLVFDDSFVHWVSNEGTKRRYTFMVTCWHPELNALERAWMYRVISALG